MTVAMLFPFLSRVLPDPFMVAGGLLVAWGASRRPPPSKAAWLHPFLRPLPAALIGAGLIVICVVRLG